LRLFERIIGVALGVALVLVAGSVWLSGVLVTPAIEAMHDVNRFENLVLRSHLAVEERRGARSASAVLDPLDAAAGLCADGLADVGLPGGAARQHPCDRLVIFRAASEAELGRANVDGGGVGYQRYEAVFSALVGDAEELDASLAATLVDTQRWVRVGQIVTAGLLAGLLVLIGLTTRVQGRTTDRLTSALQRQASHDALTGVHNRLELRRVLEDAHTHGRPLAVLFLDLDRFRTVNDTVGHAGGDALLVAVANQLRKLTRPQDTVVRLGGDEFAVVCPDAGETVGVGVAGRIVAGLRHPLLVEGRMIAVSASVGVTSSEGGEGRVADVKREADIAMYVAKAHGGDRFEVYRPQMHAEIVERIQLTDDLRAALASQRVDVAYQPIVAADTGQVLRVEALARWAHPDRGAIPPDVFIGLAEDGGFIDDLGAHVLYRACADVRRWHDTYPTAVGVGVAVNVSTLQLTADGFLPTVRAALAENGLAPGLLTLEVTEGALTGTHAEAESVLARVRELGVRVAVDDFGTGHSSLSRLRDLRVHELKIDRSFVAAIDEDTVTDPLITSILALARGLGLEVVAEGVETPAQLRFLADHGCDLIQGYLLSKPRTREECEELWDDTPNLIPAVHDSTPPAAAPGSHALELLETAFTPAVLRGVLAMLTERAGLETAYLTRIDWDAGIQHIDVAHNTGAPLVTEGLAVPWEDTLCRRMLTDGPAGSDDVPTAYGHNPAARTLGLQTYVGVPVLDGAGNLHGTLCAAGRERSPIAPATIRLMEILAALISTHLVEAAGEPARAAVSPQL
jgi:diguanylate cyclase (GGDEF)-like protein